MSSLGCENITVPTESGLADSVFVEDTALVLDEFAVVCRPGAASRRSEIPGVEAVLRNYRTLVSIQSPGTLDGGDLLCVGKVIYAGLSSRSNQAGIEQLRLIVRDHGYTVTVVETNRCLHLKSAVTQVAPETLLINPRWVDPSLFENWELIEVDSNESHGANALLVDQSLIYPAAFPRTIEKLVARGIHVSAIDVSELQKAEGAVTCCSLVFDLQPGFDIDSVD